MKVYWTQEARMRLQEIEAYIAKDSPSVARAVAGRLVCRSLGLMQLPHLGRHLPEYPDTDLRELLERSFRLVYRIALDRIEIMTVMHYRQLLPGDWRVLIKR